LIAAWRPGRSLAREFYTSPRVFERDMERVYLRHWTFVANNDYAMLVRFTPLAVLETEIEVTWLVRRDAVEGRDYQLADITWLWGNTLREDKTITENNQAGVNSRFYRPGPHSREESLDEFLGWYLAQIR
jgi:Rieske 2Fe-2S family protein